MLRLKISIIETVLLVTKVVLICTKICVKIRNFNIMDFKSLDDEKLAMDTNHQAFFMSFLVAFILIGSSRNFLSMIVFLKTELNLLSSTSLLIALCLSDTFLMWSSASIFGIMQVADNKIYTQCTFSIRTKRVKIIY